MTVPDDARRNTYRPDRERGTHSENRAYVVLDEAATNENAMSHKRQADFWRDFADGLGEELAYLIEKLAYDLMVLEEKRGRKFDITEAAAEMELRVSTATKVCQARDRLDDPPLSPESPPKRP